MGSTLPPSPLIKGQNVQYDKDHKDGRVEEGVKRDVGLRRVVSVPEYVSVCNGIRLPLLLQLQVVPSQLEGILGSILRQKQGVLLYVFRRESCHYFS